MSCIDAFARVFFLVEVAETDTIYDDNGVTSGTYLKPIPARHAVAGPIVEVLVADDGLDLFEMMGRKRR